MKKEALKNIPICASALFDGGWRYTDKEMIKSEYDLTNNDAKSLCEELKKIEENSWQIERYML